MVGARWDIVCISSIDWDFIWQGHQQVMATLAARGNRVLFIENTGIRPPTFRDLPRLRHRVARWWASTKGFRQERDNLYVLSPLIVPLPYSRIAGLVNRTLLLRSIRRWMRVMRFGRPIVWTFLPTPLARALYVGLDPQLTVYYCIDNLAASSAAASKIAAIEEKVFGEVDLVFVTSEQLRDRASRFAGHVHLFPFAVDFAKFERVREAEGAPPADVTGLRRPTAGYLGGIHQWIDQELLVAVARRMPDVTFVLVGPAQTDVAALAECPNVRLLGAKSHGDVPRYLKAFDVGLIPYRSSPYTANVYPTKLNEYLAMGLPVVATNLPEIRRFNEVHGDIVSVASDAGRFAAAVRSALGGGPETIKRRIEVAKQNSWDARIDAMSDLVEERLRDCRQLGGRIWEERLRQFYRRTRRRTVQIVATALIVYLILFWSPLPWIAARPLRREAPPVRADAIVVFGGGVGESGRGGAGYQERVQRAAQLYHAGLADHVIFSTGWRYTFHEAELMKALALILNVPDRAILLEEHAGNTHENVTFVSNIVRARGWRKVLLVSSPYHMQRALLTFARLAPGIEVVPTPASGTFYAHHWGASASQVRAIAQEHIAILYYRLRGWI